MNFGKIISSASVLALIFTLASCKKDKEEDKTYLYLQNDINIDMPKYVVPGQVITLDPGKPVRASEDKTPDKGTGCVWTCSEFEIKDTVRRENDDASKPYGYTFQVPDSIGTFVLKCSMFAEGYYSNSSERSFVTVRKDGPCKSLQGLDFGPDAGTFTDSRDMKEYSFIPGAGLDWMTENLGWTGAGAPFGKSEMMSDIFGCYYTWNEAVTACPKGWRLPTDAEFMALNNLYASTPATEPHTQFTTGAGAHMADAYFNYTKLWEYWPDVKLTNKSQLSFLPLGYAVIGDEEVSFKDLLNYATFWTSDEYDSERAYYRAFYVKYDYINCGAGYKDSMALPVRCVRNSQ